VGADGATTSIATPPELPDVVAGAEIPPGPPVACGVLLGGPPAARSLVLAPVPALWLLLAPLGGPKLLNIAAPPSRA
jgi:hypothetical protein